MAYNPFNIFRRNQKAIFAVLTVFIMFMFTLSSGLGGGADFFEWLPQWIGTKSRKGEVLCTIDGHKVYSGELDKLRRDRIVANRFMEMASMQARENVRRFVEEAMPRATPERVRAFREFQNLQMMGYIPFQAQFAVQMGQISPAQLMEFREATMQQMQARLSQISGDEKASS